MVDVQSFMWVCARRGHELGVKALDADAEEELDRLLDEFDREFVATEAGKKHLRSYAESRAAAEAAFQTIVAKQKQGEDVTDLVIEKLLPHQDTPFNRERGAWISVASAIIRDVKVWYENAKWVDPEDWPKISHAILDFLRKVKEDPDRLEAECKRFAERPESKGFQTGMLTPVLSALVPDQLLLINNKSRAVINHFLGTKHSQSIADYPALNAAGHYLINRVQESVDDVAPEGVTPAEAFDAFCHWLVAEKKYRFGRSQGWRLVVPDDEMWEVCEGEGVGCYDAPLPRDVSKVQQKDWPDEKAALKAGGTSLTDDQLDELWRFARKPARGDTVVATTGSGKVRGIGRVMGPYEFHQDRPHHRLPIEWDDTDHREVSEAGWTGSFHEMEAKEVQKIAELKPTVDTHADAAFSGEAFDLLGRLHETPRREFYDEHRDEFKEFVEEPLQRLMKSIAAKLPEPMQETLETESGLFSKIPKNDFGRGGAWDFYWGAFYPQGSKRISAAQLFVWMNRDGIDWGFYVGEYGEDHRQRFIRNVRKKKDALIDVLGSHIEEDGTYFGADRDGTGMLEATDKQRTLAEWLGGIDKHQTSVRRVLSREQVVQLSEEELRNRILASFQEFYPLILLATSDDPLAVISELVEDGPDPERIQPAYTLDEWAEATGFEVEELRRWKSAVERKGQGIFYGPPGTGKTFMAERLARHIVGGGNGFWELVQFHPAYAYEDFMQGIRPLTGTDGQLEYEMVPGRFRDFCQRATNRSGPCVLIIDEINRANLSRVFGELMYLLEYRDQVVPLAGGGTFHIPKNVRIIGTMNTADRSIALVDHALRRRFSFIQLQPNFEALEAFHAKSGGSATAIIQKLNEINSAIGDRHYHIGVTFFMDENLDENLQTIWEMEIEPYLEEYFFDDQATVDKFRWPKVKEELG
jgi:5-methylcytosine-specific restriction enzyme B